MKIAVMLLSLLVILLILPSLGQTFAVSSVTIETSQETYQYGDYFLMRVNVSEITGNDAYIYITNPMERKSLLLQVPIFQEYTEVPARNPFAADVWTTGTYTLEVEYSGAESSVQFTILDTGKIGIPFWIKDLAKMWINEPFVTDKDFARAIGYLIEHEIIKIPYTEPGEETVSYIPEWVKNSAGWWIEGKISDTEFAMTLQYLVKTGVITVNLSRI